MQRLLVQLPEVGGHLVSIKLPVLPPSLSESSLKAAPQSEIPKATALSKEREHSPVIVFPQRTQNDIKTKKLKDYRKL